MRRHRHRSGVTSARRATLAAMLRAVGTTTALLVVYFAAPLDGRIHVAAGLWLVFGVIGFSALLGLQVRSITRSDRPRLRALEVLATVAPLLVCVFALSYYLMERDSPHSFSQSLSRLDALYFTVTVFATVGFGDIVAKSETARTMVTFQMVGDLVILGLGLRVLTGAVQIGLLRQRTNDPHATFATMDGRTFPGADPATDIGTPPPQRSEREQRPQLPSP